MNGERAERHLRLAAEAGLRRALKVPGAGAPSGSRAVCTDCVTRLSSVALALTTVGALDTERADEILVQFQAALAVRYLLQPHLLQPQAAGPLLRRARTSYVAGLAQAPREAAPGGRRPGRGADYSYRRPSRRAAATGGVVLPALRRPVPDIAVVCDTSGSMTGELLAVALTEVEGLLRSLGVLRQLRVLACDAAAGPAQRVSAARQVELAGGGGTDMGAGISAAAALRPRPAITVVLTDGLQDRGLTVTLRVAEDWESFEATTSIEVTSPARPWLGTITLSDDAVLDWTLNWRAAFHGNPAALTGLLIPVLRHHRAAPLGRQLSPVTGQHPPFSAIPLRSRPAHAAPPYD